MQLKQSLPRGVVYIVTTLFLLIAPQADAQGVYRCKDKAGKVEFRDFACDAQPTARGTAPAAPIAGISQPSVDARTGLPTDRAVYEQMLDACLLLLRRNPRARGTQQWPSMRCDRIEEFEEWRARQAPQRGQAQASPSSPSALTAQPVPSVIETQVEGEFSGWQGETVVRLANGQIWQQTDYHYHYHYAYMPRVFIYASGGGFKMKLDGIEKAVSVVRLK